MRFGKLISVFTVWTDGRWYPHFGASKSSQLREDVVGSFRAKLNTIPRITITENVKFPMFKIEALAEESILVGSKKLF